MLDSEKIERESPLTATEDPNLLVKGDWALSSPLPPSGFLVLELVFGNKSFSVPNVARDTFKLIARENWII